MEIAQIPYDMEVGDGTLAQTVMIPEFIQVGIAPDDPYFAASLRLQEVQRDIGTLEAEKKRLKKTLDELAPKPGQKIVSPAGTPLVKCVLGASKIDPQLAKERWPADIYAKCVHTQEVFDVDLAKEIVGDALLRMATRRNAPSIQAA